ncbi:MAG: hypothetical protein JKY56_08950 [Kofleriaceae bacterium]|nr:hypothetical protein [Kofleriaceae bacterium]
MNSKLAPLFSLLLVAIAAIGCSADPAQVNGGGDGGTRIDAMARPDAGDQPETCNFTNCDGCCDGNVCNTTASESNCGVRGQTCQTCESGDECFSGSCATPTATCDEACDGCCEGNQCLQGNMTAVCGSLGNSCVACPDGMTCDAQGACEAAAVCDSTSCPDGCCREDGMCIATQAQSLSGCGTGGAVCGMCSNDATECVSGICVEDQPCLEFCNDGCCTSSGQCIGYGAQTSTVCGETGTCSSCSGNDSCVGGMCTLDTVWTITIDSAVVSNVDENGSTWDFVTIFEDKIVGLPDPYVTGALTNDVIVDWATQTIPNTITPNWNRSVDSYRQSDLTNEGLEFNVIDLDGITFEFIGNCIMTITEVELMSGSKNISCGPLVSDLTIDFAPQQ